MFINKINLNWNDFYSLYNGNSSIKRGGYDEKDGIIDLMKIDIENEMLKILRISEKSKTQYISLKRFSSYLIESNEKLFKNLVGKKVKKIDICYEMMSSKMLQEKHLNIDTKEKWVKEIRIDDINRKIYVFYGENSFSGFKTPIEIIDMDQIVYVDCEEF